IISLVTVVLPNCTTSPTSRSSKWRRPAVTLLVICIPYTSTGFFYSRPAGNANRLEAPDEGDGHRADIEKITQLEEAEQPDRAALLRVIGNDADPEQQPDDADDDDEPEAHPAEDIEAHRDGDRRQQRNDAGRDQVPGLLLPPLERQRHANEKADEAEGGHQGQRLERRIEQSRRRAQVGRGQRPPGRKMLFHQSIYLS